MKLEESVFKPASFSLLLAPVPLVASFIRSGKIELIAIMAPSKRLTGAIPRRLRSGGTMKVSSCNAREPPSAKVRYLFGGSFS